jgi:hypothetical protein
VFEAPEEADMFEGVRLMRPAMSFRIGSIVTLAVGSIVGARLMGCALLTTRA